MVKLWLCIQDVPELVHCSRQSVTEVYVPPVMLKTFTSATFAYAELCLAWTDAARGISTSTEIFID